MTSIHWIEKICEFLVFFVPSWLKRFFFFPLVFSVYSFLVSASPRQAF